MSVYPVLPLSVEAVRDWAVAVGDDVAGIAGARLGCIVSRAAADILGQTVLVDFDPADNVGYGEYPDGTRVELPAPLTALALWLDKTDRLGRRRRRQVTGKQVVKQLATLAS